MADHPESPIPQASVPRVSVLMCVYNGERHLREAVDSILGQTFKDFEFIIVDDGSTDGTVGILDRYEDPRIRRITNATNLGLTKSLNKGLTVCRGEFVARMDADDISLPERLERQVAFMRVHPDVGLLGSQYEIIGADDGIVKTSGEVPCSDVAIRWQTLAENAFAHGSVILRRSVLTEHRLAYDETLLLAQDFDLWLRMLCHSRGVNLPVCLYRYRTGGVSTKRRAQQVEVRDRLSAWAIRQYLPGATDQEVKALADLIRWQRTFASVGQDVLGLADRWICLLKAFRRRHRGERGINALIAATSLRAREALAGEPPSARKAISAYRLRQVDSLSAPFFRECLLEAFGYWKVRSTLRRVLSRRCG